MRWRHFTPQQKRRGVNGWLSSFSLLCVLSVPLGFLPFLLAYFFQFFFFLGGYTHTFNLEVATAYTYRLVIGCLLICLQIPLSTIHVVHILRGFFLFFPNCAGIQTSSVLPIGVWGFCFVASFGLISSPPIPRHLTTSLNLTRACHLPTIFSTLHSLHIPHVSLSIRPAFYTHTSRPWHVWCSFPPCPSVPPAVKRVLPSLASPLTVVYIKLFATQILHQFY